MKDKKLELAEAMLKASKRDREAVSAAKEPSAREFKSTTQLYHAADAYAFFQESNSSGSYDLAMRFSDNLETAARFFADQR